MALPNESSTEPTPATPISAPDSPPSFHLPAPSMNGDEETALARMADDGGPPASPSEAEEPAAAVHELSLEQRVRRLEEALSLLQEERVAAPPLAQTPPVAPSQPASTAVLLDVGKRMLGAATHAVVSAPLTAPNVAHPSERGGFLWLLWDTWIEARIIVRMFVDPRYHLPWSARVLPLLLIAAILTSYYWVPGTTIPLLGSWMNKIVDLLLAFLLFKWLGHEARRYRQTSPDVPSNLRL